jgi:hypothetical protein
MGHPLFLHVIARATTTFNLDTLIYLSLNRSVCGHTSLLIVFCQDLTTILQFFCGLNWLKSLCANCGYVVVGHDIAIRTAPNSFDMTWTMWKKK